MYDHGRNKHPTLFAIENFFVSLPPAFLYFFWSLLFFSAFIFYLESLFGFSRSPCIRFAHCTAPAPPLVSLRLRVAPPQSKLKFAWGLIPNGVLLCAKKIFHVNLFQSNKIAFRLKFFLEKIPLNIKFNLRKSPEEIFIFSKNFRFTIKGLEAGTHEGILGGVYTPFVSRRREFLKRS